MRLSSKCEFAYANLRRCVASSSGVILIPRTFSSSARSSSDICHVLSLALPYDATTRPLQHPPHANSEEALAENSHPASTSTANRNHFGYHSYSIDRLNTMSTKYYGNLDDIGRRVVRRQTKCSTQTTCTQLAYAGDLTTITTL